MPAYATDGSAGFDLAASVDMTIAPGEVALVPTGLIVEVPAGHLLGVFARSSTPLKRGLIVANGVGVVDSDYCGPGDEIKIQVLNFTTAPVAIRRGDRLAQGVILPFARATWEEPAAIESSDAWGVRLDRGLSATSNARYVPRTRTRRTLRTSYLVVPQCLFTKKIAPPPFVAVGTTCHDFGACPETTVRPTAMPIAEPKTTSLTQ